jgi:citrate lyase subunit beta/citryl-CoA lyase
VATINAVFRPGAEEQQAAIEVLRAFEAAVREGRGVVVDANGRMIDEAVVRSARRILGKA